MVSAHGELNPLRENRTLLIYTAPHSRFGTRHYCFRYFKKIVKQRIIERLPRNLTQNLIFKILHLCIKLSQLLALFHLNHPFIPSSKIDNFDLLAHILKTLGKLLNKLHFYIEINRQIRILMCRIHRSTDKKVDIGSLFKKQARHL